MYFLDKRKLVLLLLLPYAILAAVAPLQHICLGGRADAHPPVHAGLSVAKAFDSHHRDCAACAWTRGSSAAPLTVSLYETPRTVVPFAEAPIAVFIPGTIRLTPSRAPPLG